MNNLMNNIKETLGADVGKEIANDFSLKGKAVVGKFSFALNNLGVLLLGITIGLEYQGLLSSHENLIAMTGFALFVYSSAVIKFSQPKK